MPSVIYGGIASSDYLGGSLLNWLFAISQWRLLRPLLGDGFCIIQKHFGSCCCSYRHVSASEPHRGGEHHLALQIPQREDIALGLSFAALGVFALILA